MKAGYPACPCANCQEVWSEGDGPRKPCLILSRQPNDRYGKTRIVKLRKAVDDLRRAIAAGDPAKTQDAWDRCEPWVDRIFTPDTNREREVSMAELEIKHTVKTVSSPMQAGAYGFAEGLGKATGYAVVLFALIWAIKVYLPGDAEGVAEQPQTEQH